MKGDERAKERQIVFMCALEAVYALTRLLIPFIPGGAHKIFEKLNTALVDLSNVKSGLRNAWLISQMLKFNPMTD